MKAAPSWRTILVFACAAVLWALPAGAEDFGAHWHDGKAEIDGYRLSVSRYGETRQGTAVMIFVTEPFSDRMRVKVDDPSRDPEDVVDVLKLNLVRDFQTGIYDYNTMVSVFSRTSDFDPVKVSFSSAEWCGHVYEEMRVDPGRIAGKYFSYFEGETGDFDLERPEGGVLEDNLYIRFRGLREDFLPPGGRRTVPFLPGAFFRRLSHRPAEWTTAEIHRRSGVETIEVPAGSFETAVYEVRIEGGREGTFHIETAYPHRIVAWSLLPDVRGELSGTLRVPYWKLHDNGQESYLGDLGLE